MRKISKRKRFGTYTTDDVLCHEIPSKAAVLQKFNHFRSPFGYIDATRFQSKYNGCFAYQQNRDQQRVTEEYHCKNKSMQIRTNCQIFFSQNYMNKTSVQKTREKKKL